MSSDKIEIIFITQSFGGVEIYIRQIIEHLNFDHFDLSIIAPYKKDFMDFCNKHTVTYYQVDMKRGLDILGDISAYRNIKRILKKVTPDIVHIHSSKAGVLGRIAASKLNLKHTFTPHGISYLSFSGFKRAIFIAIESFVKRYTDHVLACSYSEKIKYEFELGLNQNKVKAIANAIKIPKIDIASRKIFSLDNSVIRIGSISRLTYQKNPILFVQIANAIYKLYPHIKFEFSILGVGLTDDLKKDVIDLIEYYKLEDNFTLLEWGDKEVSKQYLESLDIFILPSIFEGLPLSLLESMSLGTISITSKCDGCNDVIQNGENGYACMTLDEYTKCIEKLMSNQDIQLEIKKYAYEYIRKYHSIENFINQLETYYISILDN